MVLLLMPILDTVDILDLLDILDTVPMVPIHMLVTHPLMEPTLPTVLIPIWDKKEASIPCSM